MDADRTTAPTSATRNDGDVASGDSGDESAGADGEGDGNENRRWLILNPVSGDGTHADHVHRLAADRGIRVLETEEEGDAAAFAREAVSANVSELAVCGGDGTLQEALSGLAAAGVIRSAGAEAIDDVAPIHDVDPDGTEYTTTNETEKESGPEETARTDATDPPTLCVIPAGTANIFATDMGITGVEEGFSVLDDGEVRRLDVGIADGEPFVKSCIAGLTADTSSTTSDDLKERFGSLAFVITGVERAAEFDPLDVEIDARGAEDEWAWSGEVLCLVIGNARRYAGEIGQADAEDGLLDVTLVEEMPPGDVVTEAVARQLLGRETENVSRIRTRRIEIESADDAPIEFSLDGEIATHDRLDVTVRERALPIRVGPTYEPDPADS